MSDDLKYLCDRADLTDLINKYATGIDTRDWKLYRSIFADEVFVYDFVVESFSADLIVTEQ